MTAGSELLEIEQTKPDHSPNVIGIYSLLELKQYFQLRARITASLPLVSGLVVTTFIRVKDGSM